LECMGEHIHRYKPRQNVYPRTTVKAKETALSLKSSAWYMFIDCSSSAKLWRRSSMFCFVNGSARRWKKKRSVRDSRYKSKTKFGNARVMDEERICMHDEFDIFVMISLKEC
jgi:hypothetical protein